MNGNLSPDEFPRRPPGKETRGLVNQINNEVPLPR
jgi:hypothetical protein